MKYTSCTAATENYVLDASGTLARGPSPVDVNNGPLVAGGNPWNTHSPEHIERDTKRAIDREKSEGERERQNREKMGGQNFPRLRGGCAYP